MDRHQIRPRLTEASWRSWDRLASTEGTTITALIEALGEDLTAKRWQPTQRQIRRARQIDRERRSRS